LDAGGIPLEAAGAPSMGANSRTVIAPRPNASITMFNAASASSAHLTGGTSSASGRLVPVRAGQIPPASRRIVDCVARDPR
jgi:hypothetical protein